MTCSTISNKQLWHHFVRLVYQPISHQCFSLTPNQHQSPAISQPALFFSHNKSISATSPSQANRMHESWSRVTRKQMSSRSAPQAITPLIFHPNENIRVGRATLKMTLMHTLMFRKKVSTLWIIKLSHVQIKFCFAMVHVHQGKWTYLQPCG